MDTDVAQLEHDNNKCCALGFRYIQIYRYRCNCFYFYNIKVLSLCVVRFIKMLNQLYNKGVFVWRWNRVDGKLWRENRKINFFMFGWVGKKENKFWGPDIFSPDPPKSFLSKMERKLGGRSSWKYPSPWKFGIHLQVFNMLASFLSLFEKKEKIILFS